MRTAGRKSHRTVAGLHARRRAAYTSAASPRRAAVFFNSQTFLYLFLPAVLAGYYAVPVLLRLRSGVRRNFLNAFLFAASVLFYAWGEREFVAVLLGSLVVNYLL